MLSQNTYTNQHRTAFCQVATDDIQIRVLREHDLERVAEIHIAAFQDSFIAKLGEEAVKRYYEWQLHSPDDVYATGAFLGDEMLGFCFGGVFSMALGGYLVRNKKFLTHRVILHPWLILNPDFFRKVLRGTHLIFEFSKIKNYSLLKEENISVKSFGILSIAIHPAFRGLGVGRILMQDSERYALRNNFSSMNLTVSPQNLNAIQFYEHLGWERVYSERVWPGTMRKDLNCE